MGFVSVCWDGRMRESEVFRRLGVDVRIEGQLWFFVVCFESLSFVQHLEKRKEAMIEQAQKDLSFALVSLLVE